MPKLCGAPYLKGYLAQDGCQRAPKVAASYKTAALSETSMKFMREQFLLTNAIPSV